MNVTGAMVITGRFRISFNRHGAAPLIWSVSLIARDDTQLWELAVRSIEFKDVNVVTVYAPKATADDDDGQPSAYLVASGELIVDLDGSAALHHTEYCASAIYDSGIACSCSSRAAEK